MNQTLLLTSNGVVLAGRNACQGRAEAGMTWLLSAIVVLSAAGQSRCESPAGLERVYEQALTSQPTRLVSARSAEKRGEHELAVHDYLASIDEDATTADVAISELAATYLSLAEAKAKEGCYVEQSVLIERCRATLSKLKAWDATTKSLLESSRKTLFREMGAAHEAGKAAADGHLAMAAELCEEARAKHFWNFNNQNKQMDALHRVNLAWSYYPDDLDEQMIARMHRTWTEIKSSLAGWRYNQVMEGDRVLLGRRYGER